MKFNINLGKLSLCLWTNENVDALHSSLAGCVNTNPCF